MPNSETLTELKGKQPTGSSKRKRKHSIKRNIVLDDNSNCNDPSKSSKNEKNCNKKLKGEKGKSVDADKEVKKDDQKIIELLDCNQLENEPANDNESLKTDKGVEKYEDLKTAEDEEKYENLKTAESADSQCTYAKQQCQNCKFCSEHDVIKEETNDSKGKSMKSKKKFICEICAKDGSTKIYYSVEKHKQHMATAHEVFSEEVKKFECTDCPETVWFPTKSKFTYHLGTKHPGVMRFICEVCTETFILKANYKNHMKTHNLVVKKKFSCDVCNGTFVNKAGYEAHKKRFPGPHIKQNCSHCGFSFSRENHMKNHRCKTLLLEEAAARANKIQEAQKSITEKSENFLKPSKMVSKTNNEETQAFIDKKTAETSTETNLSLKKSLNIEDSQSNKRVVFHRIIPRRNQDQTVYRPVQMQTQNLPESVVVQDLREIDLESGTFIAAAATATTTATTATTTTGNEPEPQFIVRDLNGHILQGNQILQLDINDVQQGEENQVYLADWNIVAPYVIREKSP